MGTSKSPIPSSSFKTRSRIFENLQPAIVTIQISQSFIKSISFSMDFTPPSHRSEPRSRTKSASRLAIEDDGIPHFSVDAISSPPKKTSSPSIQDLLLLSPSSMRKSRSRLVDRFEMNEEVMEAAGARRRCKNRGPQMGLLGCASPRSVRRSRRRSEMEIREEKDLCLAEEFAKARKRRQSGRSKKEKLSLVPLALAPSSSTPSNSNVSLFSFLYCSRLIFFLCVLMLWFVCL